MQESKKILQNLKKGIDKPDQMVYHIYMINI